LSYKLHAGYSILERLEENWKAFYWHGKRSVHNLFVWNHLLPFDSVHQIVHKYKNLQPSVFFSCTHKRSSTKRYKCVWCRAFPLKSWRIKLLWIWEIFGIFVCWVYTPICLQISSYTSSFKLLHSRFEGCFCSLYIYFFVKYHSNNLW